MQKKFQDLKDLQLHVIIIVVGHAHAATAMDLVLELATIAMVAMEVSDL